MNRRNYFVDKIANMIAGSNSPGITAGIIVDMLQEEGVLALGYGDKEIDLVTETFSANFGTTKTTKQDRWAAGRLVHKYGSQSICGIIKLLAQNGQEKFAPVVNSVAQLEEKLPSVMSFLRNIKGTEEIE